MHRSRLVGVRWSGWSFAGEFVKAYWSIGMARSSISRFLTKGYLTSLVPVVGLPICVRGPSAASDEGFAPSGLGEGDGHECGVDGQSQQ